MIENVKQTIKRFDENGNEIEPVINEYTLKELATKIIPQEVLDEGRKNKTEPYIFEDTTTSLLSGEKWAKLPDNKRDYMVSDLGRIKFENNILHQENKKENGQEKVGYLVIAKNQPYSDESLAYEKCIYSFVAETFLGKRSGDNYEVHHITNNGYDNRVENLILLTKEQHKKVHELAREKTK